METVNELAERFVAVAMNRTTNEASTRAHIANWKLASLGPTRNSSRRPNFHSGRGRTAFALAMLLSSIGKWFPESGK